MATPRPSSVATVGAVVGNVMTAASSPRNESPAPTLNRAEISGMTAAMSEPNMNSSRSSAHARPISSDVRSEAGLADIARAAAVLHLQPGAVRRRHRIVELVQVRRVQGVRVRGPGHRRVGDRFVLGHRRGTLLAERTDRLDHIRQLRDIGRGLVHRGLLLRGEGAVLGAVHDLTGVAALRAERVVQPVEAVQRLGAGDVVVVDVLTAGVVVADEQPAQDDHPDREHDPRPAGSKTTQSCQQPGHG